MDMKKPVFSFLSEPRIGNEVEKIKNKVSNLSKGYSRYFFANSKLIWNKVSHFEKILMSSAYL